MRINLDTANPYPGIIGKFLFLKDIIWHEYYQIINQNNRELLIKSNLKNPKRKILLVPHPKNFFELGAIKIICLNYRKYLEKENYAVDILITPNLKKVAKTANSIEYDFVHFHNPLQLRIIKHLLKRDFCITNHSWTEINSNPSNLAPQIIALSEKDKEFYLEKGFKRKLDLIPNGVDYNEFKYIREGNKKAICIGRFVKDKGQEDLIDKLDGFIPIDFIGEGKINAKAEFKTCKVLGSWSREKIYNNLTDYSCLILNSKTELSPLVVIEALSAGLSLVISDSACANLDKKEFISIIPENCNKCQFKEIVRYQIENNKKYRNSIRSYAKKFDLQRIIKIYISFIEESISNNL